MTTVTNAFHIIFRGFKYFPTLQMYQDNEIRRVMWKGIHVVTVECAMETKYTKNDRPILRSNTTIESRANGFVQRDFVNI